MGSQLQSILPTRRADALGVALGAAAAIITTWIGGTTWGLTALITLAAVATYAILKRTADGNAGSRDEMRNLWSLAGVLHEGTDWPTLGGWALGPDALTLWIRELRRSGAKNVVELGPGASTIMVGRALPGMEMYGLEHDAEYVDRLRIDFARLRVPNCEIIYAPLENARSSGDVNWYSRQCLDRLPPSIDALLVDGPPNWDGKGHRAPAVDLISRHMRSGGLVLVDDTHRSSERRMVEDWIRMGICSTVTDGGSFVLLRVT